MMGRFEDLQSRLQAAMSAPRSSERVLWIQFEKDLLQGGYTRKQAQALLDSLTFNPRCPSDLKIISHLESHAELARPFDVPERESPDHSEGPDKREHARTESVQPEPVRTESVQPEPVRTEAVQTEPLYTLESLAAALPPGAVVGQQGRWVSTGNVKAVDKVNSLFNPNRWLSGVLSSRGSEIPWEYLCLKSQAPTFLAALGELLEPNLRP